MHVVRDPVPQPALLTILLLAGLIAGGMPAMAPQDPTAGAPSVPTPLGPGPMWRGPVRPHGANEVFATGNGCAMCHSAAERSTALRSATGDDVSPHALWQATMMAQSFRDPYWRAQVAKETSLAPDRAAEVQALCVRCHAPMAHHTNRLGGLEPPMVHAAAADPLAQDGVSCTVCHQIQPDGLGTPATFSGKIRIDRSRTIFGPYEDPRGAPMTMHSGYTPKHGAHVQDSALCGSCHTLHTGHTGGDREFPEQTPYLEWRNSAFSTETASAASPRSCQSCHMPDLGSIRIARNPGGRDFLIPARAPFRSHTIVGGNAFMLDLLAANRDELGVTAPLAALQRTAMAARRQIADETVAIAIGDLQRVGGRLEFSIKIDNKTGHKFPTGYPSRRAWLHVQVRSGRETVFDSGGFTKDGRIDPKHDELTRPHVQKITSEKDVLVWEMVATDPDGRPTTNLTQMAQRSKDNRLLPLGWRADGPHSDDTAPVGLGDDPDFVAGSDTVQVSVPLAADAAPVTVLAWVHYQTVPPHWVDALRSVDADECRTFVRMYDAADRTPDTAGVAVRSEQ